MTRRFFVYCSLACGRCTYNEIARWEDAPLIRNDSPSWLRVSHKWHTEVMNDSDCRGFSHRFQRRSLQVPETVAGSVPGQSYGLPTGCVPLWRTRVRISTVKHTAAGEPFATRWTLSSPIGWSETPRLSLPSKHCVGKRPVLAGKAGISLTTRLARHRNKVRKLVFLS